MPTLESVISEQASVAESELPRKCAETLFLVLGNRLNRHYQDYLERNPTIDSPSLLSFQQALCNRWRQETAAIANAFDSSVKLPSLSFCHSLQCERKFLDGNAIDLSVRPFGRANAIMTIRCKFRHKHDRIQTDFSLLIPIKDLEYAVSEDLALLQVIPSLFRVHFDFVWGQLDGASRDRLLARWREWTATGLTSTSQT